MCWGKMLPTPVHVHGEAILQYQALWWANEIQPGPKEQFQSFVGWAHTWGRGVAGHSISHRKKNHVVKLRVTRAARRSIWCCRVGLGGAGKVP